MGHIQLPITPVFFLGGDDGDVYRCAKDFVIIVRAGKEFADLLVRFVGRDRLQSEVTNQRQQLLLQYSKTCTFRSNQESRIKRDQMFQA